MDLLIVRHAIALDREDWLERPDSERPLTSKGRERMKRNAAGIAVAFPQLELIATSPFVRAAETAAVLRKAYGKVDTEELPALASGGARSKVLAWLVERTEQGIALVGHEPDLGQLVAWLVTGQAESPVEMRKGGACLLTFSGKPARGKAELRWFFRRRFSAGSPVNRDTGPRGSSQVLEGNAHAQKTATKPARE